MASETERTPVEELEGRELDWAVAREVMGWSERSDYTQGLGPHTSWVAPDGSMPGMPPRYSTDIAAAWEVVEAMLGWDADSTFPRWIKLMEDQDLLWAPAEEAAEAICRAALKAVRHASPPDQPAGPSERTPSEG